MRQAHFNKSTSLQRLKISWVVGWLDSLLMSSIELWSQYWRCSLSGSLWSRKLPKLFVFCAFRETLKLRSLHSWKFFFWRYNFTDKYVDARNFLYIVRLGYQKLSKRKDESVWFAKGWRDRQGWCLIIPWEFYLKPPNLFGSNSEKELKGTVLYVI